MIPNKEIKQLANALINSQEFKEMIKFRDIIREKTGLYKRTMDFESHRNKIISSSSRLNDKQELLNELMMKNRDIFKEPEVLKMIEASKRYQRMFNDCIKYLNKSLDAFISKEKNDGR